MKYRPVLQFLAVLLFLILVPAVAHAAPANYNLYQPIPLAYLAGVVVVLTVTAFLYKQRTVMTIIVIIITVLLTGFISGPIFGSFFASWNFSLFMWAGALFFLNLSYLGQEEPVYKKVISGVAMFLTLSLFIVYMSVVGPMNFFVINSFQRCVGNERSISTALEMYAERHNKKYPKTLDELKTDMRKIPVCFLAEPDAKAREHYENMYHLGLNGYRYDVSADQKRYTISCEGKNHIGAPAGYPMFSSELGLIPQPGDEGRY